MEEIIRLDASSLRKLVVPERLDIIIKYVYIESYVQKKNCSYYTELYKRHIAVRTGGREDNKESINDYIKAFNQLIENFRVNGFDKLHPIPVSRQNGIILDGAHRLACCLYFNEGAYIQYFDKEGLDWDYKWLVKNGFEKDLLDIYVKYIQLKPESTFCAILWGPIEKHWNGIVRNISEELMLVGRKDLTFTKSTFSSVIEDMYSYECGVHPSNRIKEKINFLKKFSPSFSILILNIENPVYLTSDGNKVCKQALDLKTKIRDKMSSLVDIDKYATMHITDNPEHTKHLSNILLNEHNLNLLSKRRTFEFRKEFLNWLEEYTKVLEKYGLSKDECCIVGSSSLEVLGLRKSTDIDFILCQDQREKNYFPDEFLQLSPNVDIVYKGYHERSRQTETFTDDQIILDHDKHFYFRGLKFASIEIIRDRKASEKRPKDLKDVMLIEEFMNEQSIRNIWTKVKKMKYRITMIYQIYIVSYIRHGIGSRIKQIILKYMTEKQKENIKKYIGKLRKSM